MTAPLPLPSDIIATVRNSDDMIEALCTIKNRLQLSNAFLEAMGLLVEGHIDKVLGPTRAKNLSPMIFDLLCECLAVQFEMKINLDAVKRMESRWEAREQRNVRFDTRAPSKKIIERAKPHVLRDFSALGNAARNAMLPGEHRSKIAKKAARIRWKNQRARERVSKALSGAIAP